MLNDIAVRKRQYFKLNSKLHYFDDEQIRTLIGKPDGEPHRSKTLNIIVDGSRVFIKRIPLAKLDYENPFATRNHYQLPHSFNYNVGTLGINVYREVLAHVKTTNWVLEGSQEHFPLMYHFRVLPIVKKDARKGEKDDYAELEEYQRYLKYWDNNPNIRRYLDDKISAEYEMVLFLEYLPTTLKDWQETNISKLDSVLVKLRSIIDFTRSQGIVHFDAHFGNIMICEGVPYLTDFGLVLDEDFDLDEGEREFMQAHSDIDYGEYLSSTINHLALVYKHLPEVNKANIFQRFDMNKFTSSHDTVMTLLRNIEESCGEEMLNLSPDYVETILKYRDIIIYMLSFAFELENSDSKDNIFDNLKLANLLKKAGF